MTEGLQNFIVAYNNLSKEIKNFQSTKNMTLEGLIRENINASLINDTILQYYKNVQYDDITEFINTIQQSVVQSKEIQPVAEEIKESVAEETKEPVAEETKESVSEETGSSFEKFKEYYKIDAMLTLSLVRKNIDTYKDYLNNIINQLPAVNKEELKKQIDEILEKARI